MNKLHIKKVGVLSYAKISGILGAIFGLIFGLIYLFLGVIFGAMIMGLAGRGGAVAGGASIIYGIIALIFLPIFYGVLSFIFGAIFSLIYNLVAGAIGGIEIEVENMY